MIARRRSEKRNECWTRRFISFFMNEHFWKHYCFNSRRNFDVRYNILHHRIPERISSFIYVTVCKQSGRARVQGSSPSLSFHSRATHYLYCYYFSLFSIVSTIARIRSNFPWLSLVWYMDSLFALNTIKSDKLIMCIINSTTRLLITVDKNYDIRINSP